MTHPTVHSELVGAALTGGWGRNLALDVLRGERVTVADFPGEDVTIQSRSPRLAALLWDGGPWSLRAVEMVRHVRETRPELPILLFLPPRREALALIPDLGSLEQVRLCVQDRYPDGIERFREGVRWLLRCVSVERARRVVADCFPILSPTGVLVAHQTLRSLALGERPTVAAAARGLGLCTRTLQRMIERERLPHPKELIDWVSMIYVALLATRARISSASAARRVGISPKGLYRCRGRLLALAGADEMEPGNDWLDPILQGFTARCNRLRNTSDAEALAPVGPTAAQRLWRMCSTAPEAATVSTGG